MGLSDFIKEGMYCKSIKYHIVKHKRIAQNIQIILSQNSREKKGKRLEFPNL